VALDQLSAAAGIAALAPRAAEIAAVLGPPIGEVSTGGVSDACWTAAAGIPTLDGLGPVGDLDHAADEYIEVDSIPTRCGSVAGPICESRPAAS
jgi:glutamate carboxypeptidase